MQMFRRPVNTAEEGDRLGICVPQLDPKQLERGLICHPNYVSVMWAAIVRVHRIKYFKGKIRSKDKFHISIGHETVMATLSVFKAPYSDKKMDSFDLTADYEANEELQEDENNFMLLQFERPILAPPYSLVIGSRLEMDITQHACRLAFWGRIAVQIADKNYEKSFLSQLRVYKIKERKGIVERIVKNDSVIVKNLIKKETNAQAFIGLAVELSSGERGVIESTFGKSGKLNIHVQGKISCKTELRV